MRICALLTSLLLSAQLALGQTTPANPIVQQADKLVLEKKYESAYKLLDKADPKNQLPELLLAKEHVVLENYLMSMNHRMFALKDLQPTETVAQLRGKASNYTMYSLDIPQELTRLSKKYPANHALAKGLGDYYYATQQCHCGERDKSEAQLLGLVLRYYNDAHAHGLGDYMSYYAVGYAQLAQKHAAESVPAFQKSIELVPKYPTSHYNLAYAFMELGRPAEAIPEARAAYDLYTDSALKADAARMLGYLYKEQKQPDEAQKAYQQSLALQPQNYHTLKGLLGLAVAAHQANASELAAQLYRFNPADDQMFIDIMDIYQASNQWAEVEAFFRSQLPGAPKEPAAQGQLHFYLAILNMQLQRPKEARPHFLEAKKHLSKVVDPKNQLFAIIEKGLAETKP